MKSWSKIWQKTYGYLAGCFYHPKSLGYRRRYGNRLTLESLEQRQLLTVDLNGVGIVENSAVFMAPDPYPETPSVDFYEANLSQCQGSINAFANSLEVSSSEMSESIPEHLEIQFYQEITVNPIEISATYDSQNENSVSDSGTSAFLVSNTSAAPVELFRIVGDCSGANTSLGDTYTGDPALSFQSNRTASFMADVIDAPRGDITIVDADGNTMLDTGTNSSATGSDAYWSIDILGASEYTLTWTLPDGVSNADAKRDFTVTASRGGTSLSLPVHIGYAEFTLYVDSPSPGNDVVVVDNDLGHTFWKITSDSFVKNKLNANAQAAIDKTVGFYPQGFDNKSLLTAYITGSASSYSVPGRIVDDSNHGHDVKKTYSFSSLSSVQSAAGYTTYLTNNPGTYDLNSFNCTTAAVFVANYGNLGVTTETVTDSVQYGDMTFNFSGKCPGKLGYELWSDPDAIRTILTP